MPSPESVLCHLSPASLTARACHKPCSWMWDFSRELSLQAAFFPNILVPWLGLGVLLALTLLSRTPTSPSSLSLKVKLPFPSSGIWAALPGPPILEDALTAHREFPTPQRASNRHPPPVNPPSRSSLGESSMHAELWSHFLISFKS
jgi:hypothetical protein